MKLSIVYDTRSGNTAHMAEYIIEGMRQIEGVEARAFDLDAVCARKRGFDSGHAYVQWHVYGSIEGMAGVRAVKAEAGR